MVIVKPNSETETQNMKSTLILVAALILVVAAYWLLAPEGGYVEAEPSVQLQGKAMQDSDVESAQADDEYARATFAGGCFWCMEPPYDKLEGVISTISGYAGGHVVDPSYRAVTTGRTGHTEVVQVTYDPDVVSYEKLLEVFWKNIDPTTPNRQFCDAGSQYRTGIFTHNEEQKRLAEASKQRLEAADILPGPVVTTVESLDAFYAAEDYHQDYYRKNPLRYNFYRTSCGRDARLKQLWNNKPNES